MNDEFALIKKEKEKKKFHRDPTGLVFFIFPFQTTRVENIARLLRIFQRKELLSFPFLNEDSLRQWCKKSMFF